MITTILPHQLTADEKQHYADLIKPKRSSLTNLVFNNDLDLYQITAVGYKASQSLNSRPVKFKFYVAVDNISKLEERVNQLANFHNFNMISYSHHQSRS